MFLQRYNIDPTAHIEESDVDRLLNDLDKGTSHPAAGKIILHQLFILLLWFF